jgi:hypothetical protein
MYWKVKDNDEIYYLMHIKEGVYTKISKRDINKILYYKSIRPFWYLNNNGYVGTTIRTESEIYNIYLHQFVMNVHTEDLTSYEKTVDHINHDKLDNRQQNLRLVNMSIQNSNRDKSERRIDACELPDGLVQSDLPKYVVYRKEILNKDTGNYREYFYICSHPKLEKNWETTKSMQVSIREKLKLAKLKLEQIDNIITEKQYEKQIDKKVDFPLGIRLAIEREKLHLIYDYRTTDKRYGYRMVLKSDNLQTELNNFIEKINIKYPELKIENYTIKNIPKIKDNDISHNDKKSEIKKLPPNISIYKDNKDNKEYISFSKVINKKRYSYKTTLKSENIDDELPSFIENVNKKYPELNILL